MGADTPIVFRFFSLAARNDFIKRYGDIGEDEFDNRSLTVSQVLLKRNGKLVLDATKENILNAATRIGWQAKDDRTAVRTAYLAVLTCEPPADVSVHFERRLAGTTGNERSSVMEDLYWALINSKGFSWNH